MFFGELLFIIGVILISQYRSLDGVATGKVKVMTRKYLKQSSSRGQDNSDSLRERSSAPKGDRVGITIRKVKEENISNHYSHMRERARLPRGHQQSEFCSS